MQNESEMTETRTGHLTIFLGYASGVGKTAAMLKAANAAMKGGVDVVAGCVDTHDNKELEELLGEMEHCIRDSQPEGPGFDLDCVLQRKPQLFIVDMLACRNSKECRHKKRYQDAEELLRAGIDVYATLNILEIESYAEQADIVLGMGSNEWIPDILFESAYQVELIDKLPEFLQNSYPLEVLQMLRNLAVGRVAEWLEKHCRRNHLKEENRVHTREHILVCLSPAASNGHVIRTAAQMAEAFHGSFTAVFVESQNMKRTLGKDWGRLREHARIAEQLGAHVVTLSGDKVAQQIAEYADISGVSKIVLGRSYSKRGIFMQPSIVEQLVEFLPSIDIYMIHDKSDLPFQKEHKKNSQKFFRLADIVKTIIVLSMVTSVGFLFYYSGSTDANIIMMYMLGVLVISLITGSRFYGIISSVLSVFIYDYLFIVPYYALQMNGEHYPLTLLVMLTCSVVTSTLTGRVKRQAYEAAQKAYHTEVLLETSQKLQQAEGISTIFREIANQLFRMSGCTVLIYPIEKGELGVPSVKSGTPIDENVYFSEDERAVAIWVYKNHTHAGMGTDTFPRARCMYLAIRNDDTVFAIAAIDFNQKSLAMDTFQKNLLLALLTECVLALEKEEATARQKELALQAQQEQLRATLLRGISHDLRTPLTSISGNAGILMDNMGMLDDAKKIQLYTDIYDDSMWLISLVENLLAITRFENGTMSLRREPELLDEIIQEALRHLNRRKNQYYIDVSLTDDLLMARMDSRLIIQVFINIIDNAIKYTPAGSHIWIQVLQEKEWISIEISDDGPGIPEENMDQLFEMFYTVGNDIGDSRRSLGLGLALCKSIINAHGGHIWAKHRLPYGAVFGFSLLAEEVTFFG